MRILVLGGAGFVGSSAAVWLKQKYPHYDIRSADNLKRRGSEFILSRLRENGVGFSHLDIRNPEDFDALEFGADCVIDCCAEPSVLAGLHNTTPNYVINTNLMGTVHGLNYALRHHASFLFLSSSRVYPIQAINNMAYREAETRFELESEQPLTGASQAGIAENFPMDGARSFYGATKLASELLIEEYREFYGLKTVINRCGLLSGPWQMGKVDQGVVMFWLARHYFGGELNYIGYAGSGKQVRDVLHMEDLMRLVDMQIHDPERFSGEVWNVGGGRQVSLSLQELTQLSQKITGNTIPVHSVPETRTADIRIYLTDSAKLHAHCGWRPELGLEAILEEIHAWLVAHESLLKPLFT